MKIEKKILEYITAHAQRNLPIEACGYLAGRENIVTRAYEMKNIDESREHYSMDPKEQFAVMKKCRNDGLEIYAVYHSHPSTPARPSEEDIKLAYDPSISYVIISLSGKADIKSFRISNSNVTAENIEVINE